MCEGEGGQQKKKQTTLYCIRSGQSVNPSSLPAAQICRDEMTVINNDDDMVREEGRSAVHSAQECYHGGGASSPLSRIQK